MRTIITLADEQAERLATICKREGISRSEAIRRAVEAWLQVRCRPAGSSAFGIWRDRDEDGLAYQQRLRADWQRTPS